jgi:hypothetical protein
MLETQHLMLKTQHYVEDKIDEAGRVQPNAG